VAAGERLGGEGCAAGLAPTAEAVLYSSNSLDEEVQVVRLAMFSVIADYWLL
jgi:hypothetical protein